MTFTYSNSMDTDLLEPWEDSYEDDEEDYNDYEGEEEWMLER